MPNQKHLNILKQGVEVWNQWRKENTAIPIDLSGYNFQGMALVKYDLSCVDLRGADLKGIVFFEADLRGAQFREAHLNWADFRDADLKGADFSKAELKGADFGSADLRSVCFIEANLNGANLIGANLSGANFTSADLTGCRIYGISAWDVHLDGTIQDNLVISVPNQPMITVDNLEVAQFIYLLLNNKKIRRVIDTITSKVVLILGRFTLERKVVLDALRQELRKHNYLPILFDFEKPNNRDFTETVRTLAHLARFIIADLTDPSSVPQELHAIVPDLEVPVVPLLEETKKEFAMFVDFSKYYWVLPVFMYKNATNLLASLENIIDAAEKSVRELAIEKAKRLERP